MSGQGSPALPAAAGFKVRDIVKKREFDGIPGENFFSKKVLPVELMLYLIIAQKGLEGRSYAMHICRGTFPEKIPPQEKIKISENY